MPVTAEGIRVIVDHFGCGPKSLHLELQLRMSEFTVSAFTKSSSSAMGRYRSQGFSNEMEMHIILKKAMGPLKPFLNLQHDAIKIALAYVPIGENVHSLPNPDIAPHCTRFSQNSNARPRQQI